MVLASRAAASIDPSHAIHQAHCLQTADSMLTDAQCHVDYIKEIRSSVQNATMKKALLIVDRLHDVLWVLFVAHNTALLHYYLNV